MSGNTWGHTLCVTTAGESHGPAEVVIIDGCPPNIPLSEADFVRDLNRRRTGASRFTSQRQESDQIEILSGVFEGCTTGTALALLIRNDNARSRDYEDIKNLFRPGHADYTYFKKYGLRDYRGGGRASARETVMRVAAGVVAKKYLQLQYDVEIRGCCIAVGSIMAKTRDWACVEENPFFFPDSTCLPALEALLTELRRDGDSIGARIYVEALSVPAGWGEPIFDRLSADIAKALMSIPAVKAVEIGDGFEVVQQRGSFHRDEMTETGFVSNHAGGVLGGISTGQPITASLALKPASSICTPGRTINEQGETCEVVTKGRHDPCVGLRAVPIAEAMLALTLMDHALRHRAQNGDQ